MEVTFSKADPSSDPNPIGFVIQTYVPLGEPAGLKLVERDNWNGVLFDFTASSGQSAAMKRDEMLRSGVYILSDEGTETGGTPRIYVGEADVLKERLPRSMDDHPWWTRAIACTAKDDSLTKAHALHLETRLIAIGKKAGQSKMDQKNSRSLLTGSAGDVAERYLQTLLEILPFIGVGAFEVPNSGQISAEGRLVLDSRGAKAFARETGEGFVVEKGSVARADETNSIPEHIRARRAELIESKLLLAEGEKLVLSRDLIFPSSTAAAAVMVGGSISGPEAWRDSEGRSLNERQADSMAAASADGSSSPAAANDVGLTAD